MACLLVKRGGAEAEAGGVLVGAGDVRADRDAPVGAGGVLEAAVEQGLVALVDARQQRVGIVVDGQMGGLARICRACRAVMTAPVHWGERLINLLTEEAPGTRLCCNTSPENTVEALRRWIQA